MTFSVCNDDGDAGQALRFEGCVTFLVCNDDGDADTIHRLHECISTLKVPITLDVS